ncbi:hypothetical protein BTS2_2824 [Bacillus sp. TS-2]|nr:hypothetical protein BTS2_2824 [Bacillus sp. TS-2]
MKKLLILAFVIVTLTSLYYDLTIGTLPGKNDQVAVADDIQPEQAGSNELLQDPIPFQEVIVEPGYTVLSIVEHLHTGPIPATIQEVIYDFKQLNNGTEPEHIQIGQSYYFPLYDS